MYTFDKLEADIVGQNYNAVSIGKSVNGRDIYAIKVGNGGENFFFFPPPVTTPPALTSPLRRFQSAPVCP